MKIVLLHIQLKNKINYILSMFMFDLLYRFLKSSKMNIEFYKRIIHDGLVFVSNTMIQQLILILIIFKKLISLIFF